jgi:hypothetical protein
MIGLPGSRETVLSLHARHSDMCRFNPDVKADRDNYDLVKSNMADLFGGALRISKHTMCSTATLPNTPSGPLKKDLGQNWLLERYNALCEIIITKHLIIGPIFSSR